MPPSKPSEGVFIAAAVLVYVTVAVGGLAAALYPVVEEEEQRAKVALLLTISRAEELMS